MVKAIPQKLSFGSHYTDNMFVMEWNKEKGWHNERIQTYQDFMLDPASSVFHYGQEIFEGMKAFRTVQGNAVLFRPRNNLNRMNNSAKIMCMPEIDVEHVLLWLKKLITIDYAWIPSERGTSLYIRPTMIATEKTLNLKPATHYIFFVILSPVGFLYEQGFNPISMLVSENYTRASRGGVGRAKTGGNYGASMRAQSEAQEVGCSQVLWLDPVERKYIEEVGAMNIFFVINDSLVTPALTDSILAGITRQSVIELSSHLEIPVYERQVSIDEIVNGIHSGSVQEIFGSGTAASIAPVGALRYKDTVYTINGNTTGIVTQKIFTLLTDIQYGDGQDIYNWVELVG